MDSQLENNAPPANPDAPLVVAVGASAGGLDPLKTFVEALPESPGMAFIIIMHLAPEHKSNLAEILGAHTPLAVQQVKGKTPIKPDHVYIIPPKKTLSIRDGRLTVSQPDGSRPPEVIDRFFRSLGAANGRRSVGIVLSGTGSDGAVGIKSVAAHGGLTIAQDPDEARHESMPRNAIDTGQVDKILPAGRMPEALMNYRKNISKVQLSDDPDGLSEEEEQTLAEIFSILKEQTDHDFSHYKRTTMLRRIQRRMHVHSTPSLAAYLTVLADNPDEATELFRDLLISVTNFFRDPEAFEALETDVIPDLFEDKDPDDELRVWVPGCATGEEAYSIAMLLAEYAENLPHPPQIQLFATDIDRQALRVARAGRYPESIAADLTKQRLQRFFNKDGYRYAVKEELRDMILFSRHDLLGNPPFSKQDLVSCRNLLIYLNRKLQGEVFNLFHYALRQRGVLFLGSSDSNLKATELFSPLDQQHRIYKKKSGSQAPSRLPRLPLQFSKQKLSDSYSWKMPAGEKTSMERLHQRAVTRRHAPPSVIINASEDVLHATGNIGRYVNYTPGEPSRNILDMVLGELRQPLRSILYRASKQGAEPVARTQVQLKGDRPELVEVHVEQLQAKDFPDELMLVVFKKVSTRKPAGGGETVKKEDLSGEEPEIIDELENELTQTKQELQDVVEDYETSHEELRSSNEELQSMNEELQSTTEELETSQEELRSVNEELKTVNQQLEAKVRELQQANDDLKNLMEATEIAIIFVDRELRLQRFTSKATDLFNLAASDNGRPLAHFTHRLAYDGVMEDISNTLDRLDKTQKQVTDAEGNSYIMRLRPYHTTGGTIEGVVITLVDVSELKAARVALAEKVERIKSLQREIIKIDLNERWNVGQYLHDEVAQSMAGASLILDHAKEQMGGGDSELTDSIDKLTQIISQSLLDIRNLSHQILPVDVDDEGMEYVFQSLAGQVEKAYNLNCEVEVGKVIKNLDNVEIATHLYRIVQEAAKNAALHGQADNIRITLQSGGGQLQLAIEDDGRGFPAPEDLKGGGMGIQIMRHRMELMGGTLEITASSHFEAAGARIVCRMPLDGPAP